MAFTRNWLKTQIQSYLKDHSIAAELDTWIDVAAKRVSQVLECWEMEGEIENSLASKLESGIIDGGSAGGGGTIIDGGDAYNDDPESQLTDNLLIPSNVKRILGVQYLHNTKWQNLRSVPKHDAWQYKRDGLPHVYLVEQRRIYPLPLLEGNYKAQVLYEAAIPAGGDNEDAVLSAYPYIFLNAALAEAWDWKQDAEMASKFEAKWQEDANKVTDIYRGERSGETLSMRAM